MAKLKHIEGDILHLARVALSGREQDVQLLLHRFAKGYKETAPELAAEVRALLREAPSRSSPLRRKTETALPVDTDTRFQLLRVEDHPRLDHEPVFSQAIEEAMVRLVDERASLEALFEAGLQPSRSALFIGPPGVGKTMAARWLARSLGRPLLILDLAAVMSSYLGRTGANLRHVLDYAKSIDCVLLLDELDAVAKRRDDKTEIGELKRLVTVLIQELDDWPATALLLAATNHADLLDPAIWRRFEMIVDFPLPGAKAIKSFSQALLADRVADPEKWASIISLAFKGRSFSDIEREVLAVRRMAAIKRSQVDALIPMMLSGNGLSKADKVDLAKSLVATGTLSQRAAHVLTGVSRDTIRKHLPPGKRTQRMRVTNGQA